MRRPVSTAILALAALFAGATAAGAVDAVDARPPDVAHESTHNSAMPGNVRMAAQLVAPSSGLVERVELYLGEYLAGPVPDVAVALVPLVDGEPGPVTTTHAHVDVAGPFAWRQVRLEPAVPVVAGSSYALVVTTPLGVRWWTSEAAPGAGGWYGSTAWSPLLGGWQSGDIFHSYPMSPLFRAWIDPVPTASVVFDELNGTLAGATSGAKAGATLPLRWRVTRDGAPLTLRSAALVSDGDCDGASGTARVVEASPGGSGLTAEGDGYHQLNWRTVAGRTGCRNVTLTVTLEDGTTHDHRFGVTFRR